MITATGCYSYVIISKGSELFGHFNGLFAFFKTMKLFGIRSTLFLIVFSGLLLCCSSNLLEASVVREWSVESHTLRARTTSALMRYYAVIKSDSLQIRYVRQNANRFPFKVRAQITDNDSLGRMLLLSLGQLRLFSTENLRIALGDDLYEELLRSRNQPGTDSRLVDQGDSFDHNDWLGDHRFVWSLWERLDVRVAPELNAFAGLGAPESNLNFWADGTARLGLAAPGWEFAMLVPFASGSAGLGPLRPRLLAPGFGATGTLRYSGLTARLRFTGFQDIAEESTRKLERLFVHSVSGEVGWRQPFTTNSGRIDLNGGVSYEEFTELKREAGLLVPDGQVRRLSPVVGARYTTTDENLRLSTELYDFALRGEASVRLTSNLWLELRVVSNELIRDDKVFEHPFTLFFTPMIKF